MCRHYALGYVPGGSSSSLRTEVGLQNHALHSDTVAGPTGLPKQKLLAQCELRCFVRFFGLYSAVKIFMELHGAEIAQEM